MLILLPRPVVKKLRRELRRAGIVEVGGVLMGEHLHGDTFRVVDISVQHSGASQFHFVRDPQEHQRVLKKFFEATGEDYSRFNYLGEWHSHPSFDGWPSCTDVKTMQSIVDDPGVGANFLVLVISKLGKRRQLELTATVVTREGSPFTATILSEGVGVRCALRNCLRAVLNR